jgi:hypothetical protein
MNSASSDFSSEVKFEIGHVLFIDIVGYSKLLITEQSKIRKYGSKIRQKYGSELTRQVSADGRRFERS